jgi:hypothetical protein
MGTFSLIQTKKQASRSQPHKPLVEGILEWCLCFQKHSTLERNCIMREVVTDLRRRLRWTGKLQSKLLVVNAHGNLQQWAFPRTCMSPMQFTFQNKYPSQLISITQQLNQLREGELELTRTHHLHYRVHKNCHWSLFRARRVRSISKNPNSRSTLIISSYLFLRFQWPFSWSCPNKILHEILNYLMHVSLAQLRILRSE